MYSQPQFSVSQPPSVGPMDGAKVAVMANSAMPLARWCSGSLISVMVNASGISAPPVKPCSARNTIMLSRLHAMEQSSEANRKPTETHTATRRAESSCTSQAVSGLMMISATRKEAEIHEPSSSVADSAPWMSFSDELVIWISSTAMKAPSMALITTIQSRRLGSAVGRISASPAMAFVATQVHGDLHRHAGADQPAQRIVGGQGQLDRDALYHLGEVARGIVRRQQAELRAGGGEQAVDAAFDGCVRETVEQQFGRLSRAHAANLGFLEVGLDPDVLIRHQRQQVGATLYHLAFTSRALANHAADRRMNLRAREVEIGLFQIGPGGKNQRIQALEFGVQAGHLLALRLQIGLSLGQL